MGIRLYLNLYFYDCIFLLFASVSVCAQETGELKGLISTVVTALSDLLQGTRGNLLQNQDLNRHLPNAGVALQGQNDYSTSWLVKKMQRSCFLLRFDLCMIST